MRQRKTKQLQILEQEIKKMTSFFSAEDVLNKAQSKQKGIGIATIYRLLTLMEKNNELHSYVCNRKKVYSFDKLNHSHFHCEKCGKTTHINIEKIDFLKNSIEGTICHFQIDMSGICKSCMKK